MLGEIVGALLEVLVQIVLELGFRGISRLFSDRPGSRTVLAFLAYLLCGLATGGLSLLAFPSSFVRYPRLRVVNLVASPIVAGLVMVGVGSYLKSKGKRPAPIDTFSHGFAFAFGMAIVRFLFARY